ncbi:methyltransferase domain-containing protein [Azospira inquinata]|uniref:Trans-aconitate 2-methyltransferase n=1 Tax=Azospira inquinata TaxID=2785627 RepID=A0A975SPZ0_9RHOO|nr:methyltransferase domain-containing protein [Azospira inquinata]QWT47007.1 methyltransferase domain-containing protein [Azospira inquinata]QWT50362.1 methyltransferase domain-containing protein [Azospira inquinata]
MAWNPDQYLQFASQRLRPARDLLGAIFLERPRHITDLGCGPGNVTALLHARWPEAALVGVDRDPAMLARARQDYPALEWRQGDAATWVPDGPQDLIFSNAALHWLGGHDRLFPRLMDCLAPGGVLAVQMPANFQAPSHALIRALAARPPWADLLAGAAMGAVAEVEDYYRLLAPLSGHLELWTSEYWQALEGANPVLGWLQGTTLVPYLAPLDPAGRQAFLGALGDELARAYPPDGAGVTLYPFRRLFLVAYKPGTPA